VANVWGESSAGTEIRQSHPALTLIELVTIWIRAAPLRLQSISCDDSLSSRDERHLTQQLSSQHPRPPSMLLRFTLLVCLVAQAASAEPGDLWKGLSRGPYNIGFQLKLTVDPTRNIDSKHPGTLLGIALWYPASQRSADAPAVSQLDYHLLEFSKPLEPSAKQAFIDEQAKAMVAWRHIGIVPLTVDQARATFSATGHAVRDAPRAVGKFPVVVILGGPWYLSTTAEFLASRGYLVVAPVHFQDARTEVPSNDFRSSIENSLCDAEWTLAELRHDPNADMSSVTSLGHGGGGLQALLLGMRDRQITAVANIDAAIFSSRTNPSELLFFDPRLMRVPYLYLLTADTRRQSDHYSDFEKMKFSRRYEVVLNNPDLRHHDLSNVGRAVSASLGIRGDPQSLVLKTYADIQTALINFLDANQHRDDAALAQWLRSLGQTSDYTVSTRDSIEPAPELFDVLDAIERWTPDRLRDAHQRDPEAEIFSEDGLLQLLSAARSKDVHLASSLVPVAAAIRPTSIQILERASAIAESAADLDSARDLATTCVAMKIDDRDWRAQTAQQNCRGRLGRLRK
jgi:Chlorophyllase